MRTKCQIARDAGEALAQFDEAPAQAARFEQEGWTLTFAIAPRCDDPDCDVCRG